MVRARSARLRRSSRQSGKYKPSQLGNRQIQCVGAGIELAVPIPVALIDALAAVLAIVGTTRTRRLQPPSGHGRRWPKVERHAGEVGNGLFGQHGRQVDIVGSVHRVDSFARVTSDGLLKNHTMTLHFFGCHPPDIAIRFGSCTILLTQQQVL